MNDGLLLDTCAAIWIAEGQGMTADALRHLARAEQAGAPIRLSPITAWEVGLLVARGRLHLAAKPSAWYRALLGLSGLSEAPMGADVLIDASFLPGSVHSDPADRIIISTARSEGLSIVTRDRKILQYAEAGHVRALAC